MQTLTRSLTLAATARRPPRVVGALALCLYPFLLTSAVTSIEHMNAEYTGRLVVAFGVNAAFFAGLLGLVSALPIYRLRAGLLKALFAYLALFTFASIGHYLLYAQLIGAGSLFAILDSPPEEAAEFVNENLKASTVGLAALAALPLLLPLFGRTDVGPTSGRMRLIVPALAGIVLAAALLLSTKRESIWNHNPILFVVGTIVDAVREKQAVDQLYSQFDADLPQAPAASQAPATHVLVIGESTTSRHMSLYGYGRPTTPRLDALRPQLRIAQNACSSRGSTIPQLKELMTFASREDAAPLLSGPSLVQTMRRSGFRTYWLSNQQMGSSDDTWTAIFARPADEKVFVNKRGSFTEGVSLDERLFAPFSAALADGATHRFVVVHLIGTHATYALRHPASFAVFAGSPEGSTGPVNAATAARVNAYDNAVLYNDFVVASLIERMRGLKRATLTYLSDHGEALGVASDFVGHVDGPAPRQVYEVPLLFHLSPDLERERRAALGTFEANLRRPLQTDRLIHTLLDLYDVRAPLAEARHSLLRDAYRSGPRYCDTLDAPRNPDATALR